VFNRHAIRDAEVIIYTLQILPPSETDFSASTIAIALDRMYEQNGTLAQEQIPFLNREKFILMTGYPTFIL
jgi:hypothetical protein